MYNICVHIALTILRNKNKTKTKQAKTKQKYKKQQKSKTKEQKTKQNNIYLSKFAVFFYFLLL